MDYRQIKAREAANKRRWLAVNPRLPDTSGIYIMTRREDGFKYAYVGQAKHILTRLAQHLEGYKTHIDLSLRKHGLFSSERLNGWTVIYMSYPDDELDEAERHWIRSMAADGHQLLNATSGGQDKGKHGIAPNKPSKGYRDGLEQGYLNARRYVAKLFEKSLTAAVNGKPNKNKERAMEKFNDFIEIGGNNETEQTCD